MDTNKCEKCLHGRLFVSESGFHYGCALSPKIAMVCLLDRNSRFVEHPMRKDGDGNG